MLVFNFLCIFKLRLIVMQPIPIKVIQNKFIDIIIGYNSFYVVLLHILCRADNLQIVMQNDRGNKINLII